MGLSEATAGKKPDEIIGTIKQNEIINIGNAKNILVAATKKEILVIQEQFWRDGIYFLMLLVPIEIIVSSDGESPSIQFVWKTQSAAAL